ncbi:DUF6586 family protein [Pseudomonas sp. RIT-PI-AD]|uniref:DUF6586 family protein n=1 Tax=Pseudomonas sp. RIT-PI-AD TaxID=3035294 RepID=UPI0021DA6779|nr:DUF6586 family protein [Pseudomonas sp. RIT-PI-AD]
MAQELYTRTNQKIYFAGLALESWRKAEGMRPMNAQALFQAEREAALFHLYGALLGLCHEIAGYYRLPEAAASRAEAFLTPAVLAAAPSPELAELVELAQQPETWLARLLAAYQGLFLPLQAPRKTKVDPTLPLIQAVTLEEEVAQPLTRDELEAWRQALKGLALRYREALSEC